MAARETVERIVKRASEAKSLTAPVDGDEATVWLAERETDQEAPRDAGLKWLLATTHGAVIWGEKRGGGWVLSDGQSLPAASLLDLRAFGESAEVFVWRDGSGLRARRRVDGQGDELDTLEETQLMWGTEPDPERQPRDGFFPLRDGDQGLRHAPPLALDESYFVRPAKPDEKEDPHYGHRPARLRLRHYIGEDKDTGVARIMDSRLVELFSKVPEKD